MAQQSRKKNTDFFPKNGETWTVSACFKWWKHKHLSKTSKSLVCIWTLTISIISGLWPGPSWTRRSPPWSDSPAVYTPSGYGNPVAKKHTLCTLWHILTPCCPLLDISFACQSWVNPALTSSLSSSSASTEERLRTCYARFEQLKRLTQLKLWVPAIPLATPIWSNISNGIPTQKVHCRRYTTNQYIARSLWMPIKQQEKTAKHP